MPCGDRNTQVGVDQAGPAVIAHEALLHELFDRRCGCDDEIGTFAASNLSLDDGRRVPFDRDRSVALGKMLQKTVIEGGPHGKPAENLQRVGLFLHLHLLGSPTRSANDHSDVCRQRLPGHQCFHGGYM